MNLKKHKKQIIPALFILSAVVIRLFFLFNRGRFWFDEGISYDIARYDIFDLLFRLSKPVGMETTITDNFPPFYYILLHLWMAPGSGEAYLRLFSLLFGALAILMTWKLAKKLFGENTALWSVFLMSISAFNIYYSIECRAYTLFLFLSLCSFYYFLKIIENGKGRLLYIISTILCVYTFYYGFFIVAIENIIFFGYLLKKKKVSLGKWIPAQAMILFSFLPWMKIFYHHFFWTYPDAALKPSSLSVLAKGISVVGKNFVEFNVSMGKLSWPAESYKYILLFFGAWLVFGFFALWKTKGRFFILSVYLLVPLAAQAYISEKDVVARAFIFLTPVYYIVLSRGIVYLKERKNIPAFFILLSVLSGIMAVNAASLYGFYHLETRANKITGGKDLVGYVNSRLWGRSLLDTDEILSSCLDAKYGSSAAAIPESEKKNSILLVDRGKLMPFLNYYCKNRGNFIGFLSPRTEEGRKEHRNYVDECLSVLSGKYDYFWIIYSPIHIGRSNFTESSLSKYLTKIDTKNFKGVDAELYESKIKNLFSEPGKGFYQFMDSPVEIEQGKPFIKENYILTEGFYNIYIIAGHSDSAPFYGNMALFVDSRLAGRERVGANFNYMYKMEAFIGEGSHDIKLVFEKDLYGIKKGRYLYIKDMFFVKAYNENIAH